MTHAYHVWRNIFTSILLLAVAGCSEEPAPLRIAVNPWPGYVFLHLANELGYFKEEGVEVELVDFLSLGDSSRAYERGQVDGWGTTTVELLLSHHHSTRQSTAVWVTNVSRGGDMLLARKNIQRVSDLKGKRIGLEPATVDVTLVYSALLQAGLRLQDTTLVPLAHSQMAEALLKGEVDAIAVYPPLSLEVEDTPGINRIFDSSRIPNTIIDVLAFDAEVIQQRHAEISGILRGFLRAQQFATEQPAQARPLIAKYIGIELANVDGMMRGIQLVPASEQARFLQTQGILASAMHINIAALRATGIELKLPKGHSAYSPAMLTELSR